MYCSHQHSILVISPCLVNLLGSLNSIFEMLSSFVCVLVVSKEVQAFSARRIELAWLQWWLLLTYRGHTSTNILFLLDGVWGLLLSA